MEALGSPPGTRPRRRSTSCPSGTRTCPSAGGGAAPTWPGIVRSVLHTRFMSMAAQVGVPAQLCRTAGQQDQWLP